MEISLRRQKGDADTLAGFVLENIEQIPQEGQILKFNNLKFTIEKINKKRIVSIKTEIQNR